MTSPSQDAVAVLDFDARQVASRGANMGARVSDNLVAKLSATNSVPAGSDWQYLAKSDQRNSAREWSFDGRQGCRQDLEAGKRRCGDRRADFSIQRKRQRKEQPIQTTIRRIGHVELSANVRLLNVETGVIIAAISKVSPTRDEVLSEQSRRPGSGLDVSWRYTGLVEQIGRPQR